MGWELLYCRRRLEGLRRYSCTPWSGDTRDHAYNDYEAGHTPHQGGDVELNKYWSGGLSVSRSCSAG